MAQMTLKTGTSGGASASVVQTDQVRAELVAHAPQGVAPGQPLWVGLKITHQPQWHTYWKNPGDSGLATTVQWTLPTGVTAGDVAWPAPHSIPIGTMTNYGYEGTVLLPVPLTISPAFVAGITGDLEIKLNASWLVCRQECIPQDGNFVLHVPTKGSVALNGADFDAARLAAPTALAGTSQSEVVGNVLTLTVNGLPAAWQGKALLAFPETGTLFDTTGTPGAATLSAALGAAGGAQAWMGNSWTGRFAISDQRVANATSVPMVLRLGDGSVQFTSAVSGNWPPMATPAGVSPALQTALDANRATTLPAQAAGAGGWAALGVAVLAALLGGLILNLMPCVLPVLAIKVMAVAQHAHQSRSQQRLQGVAYAVGVIGSFVALGALMLALRAGGEQLGWGFHLQSPGVLAALAVLFTLLALNLAGLFEIGNVLPQGLATLQAKHPAVDAFLSGVLAVAIASPCSAPFMGASLGYAITLPAVQALAIFAALGVGLALPFLAAAWVPAIANWLPRPGAWMDTLRRFMAFPMFATVVWLVWVLGHLSGVNGASALLALLVALACVVWALGLQGHSRTVFASISVAAAALLVWFAGPFVLQMEPLVAESTAAPAGPGNTASPAAWQAWVPGRVEAELAAGKPVFVDFTAAWCITCQYNKKTTLANAEVVADFAAKKVQMLRADWTRRDPAITQALEQLGRTGVPVYVLYQAGKAPVVFSEILDAGALRAAIAAI
ncbi:MAG: protein-disulfide reductase [Burkholderiales bacterium PBB3]|nr:MAG: protein-disulfide reductase [Burkholderiales bacterium PBB3]